MEVSYDPTKAQANLTKHGVSLSDTESFEWDTAIVWMDGRRDYGEIRMTGIGYIGLRLHVVVFTDRDNTRRIISLRKADDREIKHYAKA
jgi:uncharacterized DUF497 family protein